MALTNEDLQAIASLMDNKIDPLKSDIQGLKSDVQGLKSDVQGLKSDVQGLKSDVQGLKSDVQGLKSDVINLSDRIEILEIKQDVTSRKLEDLTFRVASMEHNSKKESKKLNDEIETLIAVLEAKNILPKQA